jgi:biopolymer transport protein ExbD
MKMPQPDMEEAKFAMAPLIDMVFLLLVFFMTASHLSSSQSLPLEVPFATKGVVPKDRPHRWVVNVVSNGTVYSGMEVSSIDALKTSIKERMQVEPQLKVYVRADANTSHRDVRKVLMAMAEVGIDDFIFGVYTPSDIREAMPR